MSFLSTFMRSALRITGAEHAAAFDTSMTIVDSSGLEAELEAFVLECIRDTMTTDAPVITDNYSLSIDPSQVPHTNQVLPALRAIVVIPVAGYGAIYLSHPVRDGLIPRDMVEKLFHLAAAVIEQGQTEYQEDELLALYNEMS
ncbi:MAG: hypothetical protein D6737_18685 [Chloroflexi bacterium]|nr:MAG: hypothetical protein CUN54_05420 [Phototrophicales bacterium]RMF77152.1 MAG: hypothetical protein D6737_18685 [Chloroflexota bacterium]